jgi:hypothetical protein
MDIIDDFASMFQWPQSRSQSMPVRELSREQAYTGNEFAVTYIVQFQNGGCVMSGISIGLPGGTLVTKSRRSFLDFTSDEKQNFIFTIFRNTEA